MDYPFFVPDWPIRKKVTEKYPDLKIINEQPTSFWFGSGRKTMKNVDKKVRRLLQRSEPYLPILVLYSIPFRDVGQYSKGGERTFKAYRKFVKKFTEGIGDYAPIVIYEPDSIPHLSQFHHKDKFQRIDLMSYAVDYITNNSNALLYLDAGHPNWHKPKIISKHLKSVGVSKCRGFSINISNYYSTDYCMTYGKRISRLISNKPFVIDTSRNGNGGLDEEWCNPPGRRIGEFPTTNTKDKLCDAFLWVKPPGESDGRKYKGKIAGRFDHIKALELINNKKNA